MIETREYKPNESDIIYHYCDANAFHSICINRKIRLNDLFSMNDYMEVHWGYYIWEKVANKLIEELGFEFIDYVDKEITTTGVRGLIVAGCFSKNGDVLSQWRGYADDGKGYVIGFKATDLLKLPVRALEILYDENQQIAEIEKVVRALYDSEKKETIKFSKDFDTLVYLLGYDLSSLKNPAFSEEQEIRLVHLLDFQKSEKSLKLNDYGGVYFGEVRKGEKIQFRIKENIPTAFIELDFSNDNKINPIVKVIIGPKNEVKKTAISIFLETIGLSNVEVDNSKASYR